MFINLTILCWADSTYLFTVLSLTLPEFIHATELRRILETYPMSFPGTRSCTGHRFRQGNTYQNRSHRTKPEEEKKGGKFVVYPVRAVSYPRTGSQKTFNNPRQTDQYPTTTDVKLLKSWHVCTAIVIVLILCVVIPVAASVTFSSSTPQVIAKGDTFSVSGTEAKNGPVAVWIFGRNYFDVRMAIPERNGNFSLTVKPDETRKFSSGKYAIVIQDPGPDGKMQIEPGKSSNGNITILNRGKKIADIGPPETLQANVEPVVEILHRGAGLQGVDDTFVADSFFVEEPTIAFDEVTGAGQLLSQVKGDKISFRGSTNVGVENFLHADIHDLSSNILVTTKVIPVIPGVEMNNWYYEIPSPGLPAGQYSLTVGWMKSNTTGTGSAQFTVENTVPATQTPGSTTTASQKQGDELPIPLIIIGAMAIVTIIILSTIRKK